MFKYNYEEKINNIKESNIEEETISIKDGIEIVNKSMFYQGRPWVHMGKNYGLDCAQLLLKSFRDVGYNTDFEIEKYGRYPDGNQLRDVILTVCKRVEYENKRDGDILLFTIDLNPQHLALYFEQDGQDFFIHSQNELIEKGVLVSRIDDFWKKRLVGIFRMKKEYC